MTGRTLSEAFVAHEWHARMRRIAGRRYDARFADVAQLVERRLPKP